MNFFTLNVVRLSVHLPVLEPSSYVEFHEANRQVE